jgi:hypothetical protein
VNGFPPVGVGVGLLRDQDGAGAFARYTGADDPDLALAIGPPGAGGAWLDCVVVADSGEPGGTTPSHLLVVAFTVPDAALAMFDDWYDSEHAPLLLEAPRWLRVRRLRRVTVTPGELNCYVLHDLDGLTVLDGPERARAAAGPKRAAVAAQPWYASSRRWMFRPAG